MATGYVLAVALALLAVYQVAGRLHHRRKDADKSELLRTLDGVWVVALRKRKRAYYKHEGRLDSGRLDLGTLLLHAEDCDHVLKVHDVKFVEAGERTYGPW